MASSDRSNFDFNELMSKAKEMQGKMQDIQGQIAAMEVVGKSGAGLVEITKLGNQYATKAKISADLLPGVSLQDREMLEDLITAAINDAVDQIEEKTKEKISQLAGLDLPGLSGAAGAA